MTALHTACIDLMAEDVWHTPFGTLSVFTWTYVYEELVGIGLYLFPPRYTYEEEGNAELLAFTAILTRWYQEHYSALLAGTPLPRSMGEPPSPPSGTSLIELGMPYLVDAETTGPEAGICSNYYDPFLVANYENGTWTITNKPPY